MKLFLSGPMTGFPDMNYPKFNKVAADLRGLGYEVINPTRELTNPPLYPRSYWMSQSMNDLLDSDGVAVIRGWEWSKGAKLEVELARALNLPICKAETMEPVNLFPCLGVDESVPSGGHPLFYQLTREEVELHAKKNHDYANGGDPLGNFKRVADILSNYPGLDLANPVVVAQVYAMKQLDAVLWSLSSSTEMKVEGREERLRDISIYAKLSTILDRE